MRKKKILPILLVLAALVAAGLLLPKSIPWGFAREVPPEEQRERLQLVETAEAYLGHNEEDGSHGKIIDFYNSYTPLAQGYLVQYTDSWCATFVSAVAIECGFTDLIPTECGCQRQIGLFEGLGRWEEDDSYVPLPGDIIYYCRSDTGLGDCTGWSDHVGIVTGTFGPFIRVIEGNYGDRVAYHYIRTNAIEIRGYAIPWK